MRQTIKLYNLFFVLLLFMRLSFYSNSAGNSIFGKSLLVQYVLIMNGIHWKRSLSVEHKMPPFLHSQQK